MLGNEYGKTLAFLYPTELIKEVPFPHQPYLGYCYNGEITYLIMWVHALDTSLTLHTLPRVTLNYRNHFRRQFQT